jgi:type VI secretion system secreted protein Hcp
VRRKILVPLFTVLLLAAGVMAALGANNPGPATAAPAAPTRAAQPSIFMKMNGATQGHIPGGVVRPGLEDWIEVIGLSHEIASPRDAASGLPTGKRQHKPFTITKELDKATPLLFKALVSNEVLTDVELRLYRPDRAGKEEHYFTIKLTNASISSVKMENDSGNASETTEHVSFVYQKIVWTWQDGGITAEDDWETPVS